MGPPEGYEPPPLDDLIDPAIRERVAAQGADLVREVLADVGIRKVGERWTRDDATTANEGTKR